MVKEKPNLNMVNGETTVRTPREINKILDEIRFYRKSSGKDKDLISQSRVLLAFTRLSAMKDLKEQAKNANLIKENNR